MQKQSIKRFKYTYIYRHGVSNNKQLVYPHIWIFVNLKHTNKINNTCSLLLKLILLFNESAKFKKFPVNQNIHRSTISLLCLLHYFIDYKHYSFSFNLHNITSLAEIYTIQYLQQKNPGRQHEFLTRRVLQKSLIYRSLVSF